MDISEFGQFIQTHYRLGIPFDINWNATKEKWQKRILDQGYNITSSACAVITVGDIEYLFSNGAVVWTSDDRPIGPAGLLMFARRKSGEIIPRQYYRPRDNALMPEKNLEAIMLQYPGNWHEAGVAPAITIGAGRKTNRIDLQDHT